MLLRVVDFETTGIPPEAAICEIGFCDVSFTLKGGARVLGQAGVLVNPGRPIPPEAMAVHHIRDADVADAPPIAEGLKILASGEPFVYVAHNAKFEREFFNPDRKPWICTLKVARRIWPDAPSHSNSVLRYWLDVDSAPDFDHSRSLPPHRAAPDAYVTAHILARALEVATVAEMIEWTTLPSLLPRINFGKHRGKAWSEAPPDYLMWVIRQADMDPDVVFTARHALESRRVRA